METNFRGRLGTKSVLRDDPGVFESAKNKIWLKPRNCVKRLKGNGFGRSRPHNLAKKLGERGKYVRQG